MTRRTFLAATVVAVTPLIRLRVTDAQDLEYIAALERAQRERPAQLGMTARIAPASEPGEPLLIHGRVVAADGRSPVANAVVFAYHTDRAGLYAPQGSPAHTWRLRGWARTDSQGRFEFHTIRPGAYPSRNQAEHVHFAVYAGSGNHHGGALEFDDDPLITDAHRRQEGASGEFGMVRKVRREGKTQHVDYAIRLNPRERF